MMYGGGSDTHKYSIYDANKSWSQDDLAWDTPWDKEGAIGFDDSEDDALFSFTLDEPDDEDEISVDITSLVSKWVNGDVDNNGLILSAPNTKGDYLSSDESKDNDEVYATFYSSDADEALRPKIVIDYDTPIVQTFTKAQGLTIIGLKSGIKLDLPFEDKSQVSIYNAQGQNIMATTVKGGSATIGTGLNSGLYFVTVNNGEKLFTEKVVIQ